MNPKHLPKWPALELTKKIKEKCGLQKRNPIKGGEYVKNTRRKILRQLTFGQTEMVRFSDKWSKNVNLRS